MLSDTQYGSIQVHLNEKIKEKGISKNKLANLAQMQRTQLNNYCKGNIQRLDLAIVARLCYVLECGLGDLFEYLPPDAGDS